MAASVQIVTLKPHHPRITCTCSKACWLACHLQGPCLVTHTLQLWIVVTPEPSAASAMAALVSSHTHRCRQPQQHRFCCMRYAAQPAAKPGRPCVPHPWPTRHEVRRQAGTCCSPASWAPSLVCCTPGARQSRRLCPLSVPGRSMLGSVLRLKERRQGSSRGRRLQPRRLG